MTTTTKITRKQKIKELIVARTFKCGASFSRTQFVRIAKQINPNIFTSRNNDANKMRSDLELVKIQYQINQELADLGFYLKSAEYRKLFYVVGGKKVEKEEARYGRQVANNIERYCALSDGIRKKKQAKSAAAKKAQPAVASADQDFLKEI